MAITNRAQVLTNIQTDIAANADTRMRSAAASNPARTENAVTTQVWRVKRGRVSVELDEVAADTDAGMRTKAAAMMVQLRTDWLINV